MIIVGGGDVGLIGFLLVLGLFGIFLALPFLMLRGAVRGSVRVLTPHGWQDPRQGPEPGWHGHGWQAPERRPVSAADVVSLRDRLAHDVSSLQPGDDPVARQALADAAERHATCSALLDRAQSDEQLRTAWLAAVEGLTAARVVRTQLGLDPGPDIPLPPGSGPQLEQRSRVQVGGREHIGSPTYEPGRPHWFPGGYYDGRPVPGGWYDAPFWPAALTAGALGALGGWTLGSLLAGGLYDDVGAGDGGWDGGWDGGGGWGDSGGGDFGGFGGGGDWGGGGDFGGGGDW